MPPGGTVTSADATFVATLKLVLSATRMVAAGILLQRRRAAERIDKRVGRRLGIPGDGRAVCGQIAGHGALEDPEIVQRDLCEGFGRHTEVLGQHFGRRVGEPVRHQQRIEFAGVAVVEADHEFAAVRAKSLQGMRRTRRKVPEVAGLDVGDVGAALRVEDGDAASAVSHDRPFSRLVPMQLADAAGGKPHVDAGDLFRDGEIVDA